MIGSGVDYSEVTAIHQKRTLAFINYFITNTASFLNNFARSVESRITEYESKIQMLEAAMDILEAKLSSVPGLEDETSVLVAKTQSVSSEPAAQTESAPIVLPTEVPDVKELPQGPEEENGMIPVKDDPTYKKFFRMLHVGVPEPAVRLKMQAEGLDPDMLSNPNHPVPANNSGQVEGQDSSGSSMD